MKEGRKEGKGKRERIIIIEGNSWCINFQQCEIPTGEREKKKKRRKNKIEQKKINY